MSETFEISGGSPTHSVVSENGKKYYYLNAQQQPQAPLPTPEEPRELQSPPQITAEVIQTEPLNFQEHLNNYAQEPSGPLHYYGENMVVRNAREMFSNVDILPDGRYFCCVCRRPYKTHATLTAHLRGSHLRHESRCPERDCNHISSTENEKRKHQKWHDKIKYSRMPKDQLRMPRKMESTIVEPKTPSENTLREQIVRSTKEVPGMKMEEDNKGKMKYTCTQCNQYFHSPYYATRHTELHGDSPKMCFYCGETRKGTVDLHVHYMRFHKNEGIRTITCKACDRIFTSTTLFRNHANQKKCELACQNLLIRQGIYYGELPVQAEIDEITANRLNFFRKRQEEREQMDSMTGMGGARGETVQHSHHHQQQQQMHYDTSATSEAAAGAAGPSSSSSSATSQLSHIFDESSNSLIQTEFGLKNFAEFKTSRAANQGIDHHNQFDNSKVKREPMTQENYSSHYRGAHGHYYPTTTQSQQQNIPMPPNYIYPPPTYGYDPLIGTYPDYQPMFNTFAPTFPTYYPSYPYYAQPVPDTPIVKQEVVTPEAKNAASSQCRLGSTSGIASDLLVNQQGDVVFDELDKLDFVMPATDNNTTAENDVADLEGIFNF